jgi:hypothetical protein
MSEEDPKTSTALSPLEDATNALNTSLAEQMARIPELLQTELAASRLYLMLTNKAEDHDDQFTQSFVFENGTLTQVEDRESDARDFYYSFSPNGNLGTFFAVPQELRRSTGSWDSHASVYSFKSDQVKDKPFPELERSVRVDASSITAKQNPVISDEGVILFNAFEGERKPASEKAEDWSIYGVINGEIKMFGKGFMPKWSSSDHFVYLKNDGVYVSDLDLNALQIIAAEENVEVYSNSRIDVSSDGTLLAWTLPDQNRIDIYERTEGSFVKKGSIHERSFWAAFSPNNTFLAIQTINSMATGRELDPQAQIEFYDISALQKVPELNIDLKQFDQRYMYLTEWVKK